MEGDRGDGSDCDSESACHVLLWGVFSGAATVVLEETGITERRKFMKKLTAVHSIISAVIVMVSMVLALLPMEKTVHLFWLVMVSEGVFLVLAANMASYLTSCFYLRKQMDRKRKKGENSGYV